MTIDDYHISLAYLRERDPAHKMLPLISRGYTFVNCSYLSQAIDELPATVERDQTDRTGDVIYDRLMAKRRQLYVERAKLSNLFHAMIHASDRISNSARIADVQAEIERVQLTIQHYQLHGEEPLTVNPYGLSKDPILLRTTLQSAMSNRSRHRKRERILQQDPQKNSAEIMAIQAQLLEDDKLILHVREAIAAGR